MNGRQETSEGLDTPFAVTYYSRLRFTYNLLPLLSNSASPRVVTVLAGGQEGPINLDDLELVHNYSLANDANHTATMTSLSFDILSAANPKVSFVHVFPGLVKTPLLKKTFGGFKGAWAILGTLGTWIALPILSLFSLSVEEAGERGLFVATSARYGAPAAESKGVEAPAGVSAARSEVGPDGELGFYRLDWDGETAKDSKELDKLRKDGKAQFVWDRTLEVYTRILI